jgi:hypothetical protein
MPPSCPPPPPPPPHHMCFPPRRHHGCGGHHRTAVHATAYHSHGRLQRLDDCHLRYAALDRGTLRAPDGRREPTRRLRAAGYAVWPARLWWHPRAAGVHPGHLGGVVRSTAPSSSTGLWRSDPHLRGCASTAATSIHGSPHHPNLIPALAIACPILLLHHAGVLWVLCATLFPHACLAAIATHSALTRGSGRPPLPQTVLSNL